MAVKIRLARGGAKKRPYYRIVVADVRAPRDGDFIEKVGTYNPLVNKDSAERLSLKNERIEYWLSQGAQPTDKVAYFIKQSGIAMPSSILKKMEIREKAHVAKPSKKELKAQSK